MATPRLAGWSAVALLLCALSALPGCSASTPVEIVDVSVRNTETYEYPTVGGDEDGAVITTQAAHYTVSEIRRSQETNWVAVYVYRPSEGFVGQDRAEIEIREGSDGASAPTRIRRVEFRFTVRE
jgi:hypothetical protein